MQKPLTAADRRTRLADYGAVRVQGADAVKFLQGQLSNDVAKLSPVLSQLAGLHNAQGRAIALLRSVLAGPDEIIAVLPRELAGPVAARLAKFVLRAKAKVTDASADWVIDGVETDRVASEMASPRIGATRGEEGDGSFWVCVSEFPARWLVITPAAAGQLASPAPPGSTAPRPQAVQPAPPSAPSSPNIALTQEREAWRALDIAAGLPQVYAATSEAFVAQMLNLDVLDGISFEKGCYTGQEVIARAHYRGRVKRRMQRFRTVGEARLAVGDSGRLNDGRAFRVVDAVTLADGRSEFLAVTAMAAADAAPDTPTPEDASVPMLNAELLSLPYALPA